MECWCIVLECVRARALATKWQDQVSCHVRNCSMLFCRYANLAPAFKFAKNFARSIPILGLLSSRQYVIVRTWRGWKPTSLLAQSPWTHFYRIHQYRLPVQRATWRIKRKITSWDIMVSRGSPQIHFYSEYMNVDRDQSSRRQSYQR